MSETGEGSSEQSQKFSLGEQIAEDLPHELQAATANELHITEEIDVKPVKVAVDIQQEFEQRSAEIEELYKQVDYWHGTGRKQNKDAQIVDVVDNVITSGGILPALDPFDITVGKQHTTSLAAQRMYAQVYSLMNLPEEEELAFQYMPRKYWVNEYLLKSIPAGIKDIPQMAKRQLQQAWEKKKPITPFSMWRFAKRTKQSATNWFGKVRVTTPEERMKISTIKSDIPGNYPVLFGIKREAVNPIPVGNAIGKFETRTGELIPFAGFTHMEVPIRHVAKTQALLDQRNVSISILPMELGEVYASQFTPREHVKGNPFKTETTIK